MSRDALVVGINTYQHLPNLNAPATDAESVARCLERLGECRVSRMPEAICDRKPVLSQQGLVTTQMLEEALIRLFKPTGKTIPHTAVFYYSGHGLQRHAGIQEGYLATSDVDPSVGKYGLSLYWLRRLLQESPVQQRVIWLDCCHSGEFFNILEADPGAKAGTDRLFMAASREYEAAYESLNSSHSVFTEALLSGLNPYKVKGGIVNGHSLTDSVSQQLKGELQQPLFESSGGDIVLTRASGIATAVQASKTTTLDRLKQLSFGFCPFPGLAPFDSTHAGLFFGREEVTQTLVNRASTGRFCALIGASGSGKTSILRAGLMPKLAQQAQSEHHPNWDIRYLIPGHSPLKALAEAFVEPQITGVQRAEQIGRAEAVLQQGGRGFVQLVQAIAGADQATQTQRSELVLVIDQFEDLFTAAPAPGLEAERRLLIDGLVAATQQDYLPLHVVIGLRANHLVDLQTFPDLYALVSNQGVTVPAMPYNQIKATLVGPLEKVGLGYDANLIYTLLLDVVGAPGELALLQMALKTLWQRREFDPADQVPPKLTLAAYAELGGIRQLLSQRANQLYEGLSADEQAIARRVFVSLCDGGDGNSLSRRQVQVQELITPSMPSSQVSATLEKLLNARLVVAQAQAEGDTLSSVIQPAALVPAWSTEATAKAPSQSSLSQLLQGLPGAVTPGRSLTPHIDIVHDSLMRNWPLLQDWLHESRPRLKPQRHIEAAAQAWQQQQRPNHPDYVLTKTRLAEAKTFQTQYPNDLSVLAIAYLEACAGYARRSTHKQYLMKLLIPLSMAMGMATAYGHSLITQPSHPWRLAQAPADSVPVFRLSEPEAAPLPDHGNRPSVGHSPQAGMVRTDMLNLATVQIHSPLAADEPISLQGVAQTLQVELALASVGIKAFGKALPNTVSLPPLAVPTPLSPAQGQIQAVTIPPINAMVIKVAELVSPTDTSVTIQVWCTRDPVEPICFTSIATP